MKAIRKQRITLPISNRRKNARIKAKHKPEEKWVKSKLFQKKNHVCHIFLCLLLFIPYSASAEESACFSENPENAVQPSIWSCGVGGGFRDGTQIVGLNAGATRGLLMFGSNERHHLTLISVSYGQIIGGVKGLDKWYQGNWELRAELFGGAQFNSETRSITGVTPHVRYHFATDTRLIPYIDAGAGLTVTEIRGEDLGGAFQFNLQAITGVHYFVKDDLSINIAMQYLHISSSAISMPNNGVNTVGCFLGVQWFF